MRFTSVIIVAMAAAPHLALAIHTGPGLEIPPNSTLSETHNHNITFHEPHHNHTLHDGEHRKDHNSTKEITHGDGPAHLHRINGTHHAGNGTEHKNTLLQEPTAVDTKMRRESQQKTERQLTTRDTRLDDGEEHHHHVNETRTEHEEHWEEHKNETKAEHEEHWSEHHHRNETKHEEPNRPALPVPLDTGSDEVKNSTREHHHRNETRQGEQEPDEHHHKNETRVGPVSLNERQGVNLAES